MKNYITVKGFAENEFKEKRSKFIGAVFPVTTHDEAMDFITKRREEYYNARHTVWAYLLKDGTARYSDDGEPQGTGGQPVLEVLKRSDISDSVIAVTRYFGGILLGTGGLTRAYSNSASMVLQNAEKVEVSSCYKFSIIANYNYFQNLERIMKENNTVILNTEFTDKVTVNAMTRCEDFEILERIITETFSGALTLQIDTQCYGRLPPKL